MDVVKAVQGYITKIVNGTGGIKVLLLDTDTTPIISVATTQSSLLNHEVYLIDRLENPNRERMRHLKCIAFLRPTSSTIQQLVNELREPKYGEYSIYFSNIVKKSSLERMAEADDHEVVKSVQEFYADYLAITKDLFSLSYGREVSSIYGIERDTWSAEGLEKAVEGCISLLLSLKKKPLIRYEKNSAMAKKLGTEVQYQINTEKQLFDFRKTDTPPILLILDRRNDPITPLLSQWTYQAMVHDLLTIHNGRVSLTHVPDIRPELREIVLNPDQDPFFHKNMYLNFGDLGANVKEYVDHFQTKTKSNMNIESIADMKRFVEDYPEFRRLSGNVSKHVTLISELSRLVEGGRLLEVSELEQSLACGDSHNADLKGLLQKEIPEWNKVRLVALYALRYEKHQNNSLPALRDLLIHSGVDPLKVSVINALLAYAGTSQRQEDLFTSSDLFSRARSSFKGLKGVENVYTQHNPFLERTLSTLTKGRLREQTHPFIGIYPDPAPANLDPSIGESGGSGAGAAGATAGKGTMGMVAQALKEKPQDVVVFMVGGVTYEESKFVAGVNESLSGVRIVLGGTGVVNSLMFLKDIESASTKWPAPEGKTASQRLSARVT